MKITLTADEEIKNYISRAIANEGCDVCPCCGETESALAPKNILLVPAGEASSINNKENLRWSGMCFITA